MLKNLGWSDEDRPAPKADVAGRAITDPTETKKSHSHRRAVGEAAIIIVMRRLRTGKTGERSKLAKRRPQDRKSKGEWTRRTPQVGWERKKTKTYAREKGQEMG